jgi:hypothetical protein
MKYLFYILRSANPGLLAAVLPLVVLPRLHAEDLDTFIIQAAPVEVVVPAAAPAKVQEVKPAKRAAKLKETSRLARGDQPILYPSIYPNPLAFNFTWIAVTKKTFAEVRLLAMRQRVAAARRGAVVRRPVPDAAAQNAIQQQLRKLLEPMLKTELSFAARATDLNVSERRKLAADGKAWFETFLIDFVKKQDPNQQQMLLQAMQGVWFGNQQRVDDPRDAVRAGIKDLVKRALPKEKFAAYEDEFRKREEFARQVSVDNLVERIDEKVKLSPDQWKKLTTSLNDHWDKSRDPQLESFALNQSMWPGAPDQWVLPELTPAQQGVLKRVNAMSGRMFFNGGAFGQMLGGNVEVIDDMDADASVEVDQPDADVTKPEAE